MIIPWPDGAWWRQDVALSGRVYRLEAQYNEGDQFWSMNLSDRDGVPLVLGLKVVLGTIWAVRAWNTDDFPFGYIVVTSDDPRTPCTPRLEDMGTRAQLVYVDAII